MQATTEINNMLKKDNFDQKHASNMKFGSHDGVYTEHIGTTSVTINVSNIDGMRWSCIHAGIIWQSIPSIDV